MTKRLKSKHKEIGDLKLIYGAGLKVLLTLELTLLVNTVKIKKVNPLIMEFSLQAKQKLKAYYGNINERQFRNIYRKALSKKGDTTENLIALLESRLDTIIYRAKLAPTVFSARQLINHGHIRVNKKK